MIRSLGEGEMVEITGSVDRLGGSPCIGGGGLRGLPLCGVIIVDTINGHKVVGDVDALQAILPPLEPGWR